MQKLSRILCYNVCHREPRPYKFCQLFDIINEGLVLLKLAGIVNTDPGCVKVFVYQAKIPQPKRNHCILASDKNTRNIARLKN